MSHVPAYVVSITPDDVGQRVSVRLRLDDGRLTDVVGQLESWSSGELVVRRRDGSVTFVDERRLVAAKVVPPAPPRRRPSAHVTIGAIQLEEIASRGWLGLESEWLGRWLLRASEGFTGRGNSVLPLGDPQLSLDEALARVLSWYAVRGLEARFQVPLPAMVALDEFLAERNWTTYGSPVHVLTGSVADLLAGTPERGDLPAVTLEPMPGDAWLSLYHYRGQDLPTVAADVLMRADLPVFASVREADQTLAIARGAVARGWLGVTALEVSADLRRRGLGTHIMRGLATWAAERGAHSIYLQVDGQNRDALSFYDRFGLYRHHTYRYRIHRKA